MAGELTSAVAALSPSSSAATAPATAPAATTDDKLIVVPAGFLGDLLGTVASTIGEKTGGFFGQRDLGRLLGSTAGTLAKTFLPFQVIPAGVTPASAGPGAASTGPSEDLVVVPAGFLSGVLGAFGGKALGGLVGGLFGNKGLGQSIGGAAGGIVSSFLPFSVVPPTVSPASAAPGAATGSDETLIVVPAGFFGDLLGAVASSVSRVAGEGTVGTVAGVVSDFAGFLPFSTLPAEFTPASATPGAPADELVLLPAGFFGSLLGGLGKVANRVATTVGKQVVSGVPGASTVLSTIGSFLPFQQVPPELVPASAGPEGGGTQEPLMFVPAGLFGSLLSSLGGTVGGAIGGLFGSSRTGQAVGGLVGQLGKILPFQVVPSGAALSVPAA